MSHIVQKTTLTSLIPTPSSWYANIFIDELTSKPKVKISTWEILNLEWLVNKTWKTIASTTYSINASTDSIILVNNTCVLTLPSAIWLEWTYFNIIRIYNSGDTTINTQLWQTISWDSNLVLTSQWDSVSIISDWSNWIRCF